MTDSSTNIIFSSNSDLYPPGAIIQAKPENVDQIPYLFPAQQYDVFNINLADNKPYVRNLGTNVPDFLSLSPSDFETIKLLGKGDVGKVYLVHLKGYPPTEQLYAMKVLDNEEMIRRNKQQRIQMEKQILEITHHPFIVTLYATYEDDNNFYLLMEYCPGGEFFRVLQSQPHKCLPELAARFYAAEVLNVLEYLHQIGVVYRDLKPENILIHKSGHIRLTDFDLSKQLVEKNLDEPKYKSHFLHFFNKDKYEERRLHQLSSFVGTAEYIAPEIITGYGYGPLVDWWALGILIYEMLFGTTPFKGATSNETFSRILHGNFEIPEHNAYGPISRACRDIIKRLLTADVYHRLGHKRGGSDIRRHSFFKGVDFNNLINQEPPIKPRIRDELDISHFSGKEVEQDSSEEKIVSIYNPEQGIDKLESIDALIDKGLQ